MSKREPTQESHEIAVRPTKALPIDVDDGFSDGSREESSVRGGGGWCTRLVQSVFGPSLTTLSLLTLAACLLLPTMLVDGVLYPLFRLIFGTLYPAYASYKAVRSKDVKEYVKWMMYWIVFALFTSAETFTDVFLSFWFPFYYEVKVILVFWLLSPMTKGSSFLYRKFVHPMLSKREQEIDEYIARAKDQGYSTVLSLGTKGVNYATSVIMQTAIKGGGGLVNQLRRSYSLSDITLGMDEINRVQPRNNEGQDRTDSTGNGENRTTRQRAYSSRQGVDMYFPEVDVDVRQRGPREPSVPLSQIRSTEDVSSGYSSAEPLYARAPTEDTRESLVRTSSVGSARVTRTRTTRAAASPGVKTRAAPTEVSGFATLPRSKKVPKKKVQ